MTCICHYNHLNVTETLSLVNSEEEVERLMYCAQEWISITKEPECSIAKTLLNTGVLIDTTCYHKQCFLRFASKSKVETARRSKRVPEKSPPPAKVARRTRSHSTVRIPMGKTVLPAICVVCGKAGRKRRRSSYEQLTQMETVDGGRLREAALGQSDERLLLLLGQDCVAAEVQYHRSCYSVYVMAYDAMKKKADEADIETVEYWATFCSTVVEDQLLVGTNFRINELLQQYRNIAKNPNAHSTQWLRYRLKRDYGDSIQIHKSLSGKVSDLVTRTEQELSSLITDDQHILSFADSYPSASSASQSSESPVRPLRTTPPEIELVHTGLYVRNLVTDGQSIIPHPPCSSDLTIEKAQDCIPPELFHLISIISNQSGDLPHDIHAYSDNDLAACNSKKVLSICQDIMGLQGKTTPKAIGLGTTLRHVTGSKYILNLLNGLGHTPSYDTVLRVETSLAYQQQQNQESGNLPAGFRREVFTTLVYDNIDFLEETLSGAGTSHYTNGIMFQVRDEGSAVTVSSKAVVKRSKKTFTPTKTDIAPFFLTKKVGPSCDLPAVKEDDPLSDSLTKDWTYLLMKCQDSNTLRHGWTGTNINTTKPLNKSVLHYLPIIEHSPTDIATVNHVLKHAMNMAKELRCPTVMVVFDQAIYCKAQMIRWTNPVMAEALVPRLGEFHTMMSFLSTIGKRYEQSGLEDMLVESGIIASGSMKGVMSGHMYNRSIRAHKLLYEAMGRLQISEFIDNMSEEDAEDVHDLQTRIGLQYDTAGVLAADLCNELNQKFNTYVAQKSKDNPTYSFWSSYLEMVATGLGFLRATRTGDFQLHLACLRKMLPWFFAYDRVNYSRYGCIYWVEMCNLEISHPWLHAKLHSEPGSWTYQRQSTMGFNGMAADQAIETTINKDSKTSGGITGITINQAALQRWMRAKPAKASIALECDRMAGLTSGIPTPHKELEKSRSTRDEKDVTAILETVRSLTDPFRSTHSKLLSLSSGAVADADVQESLLQAETSGEQRLAEFMNRFKKTRAEGSLNTGELPDFFSTIKSAKLKTLATSKHRKQMPTGFQGLKSDRSLFAQLLLVARERDVDMKKILQYSLSPVPGSLSSHDGTALSKTTKSQILHHLEDLVPACKEAEIPLKCAVVVDAMALIQALPKAQIPATYGQLSDVVLKRLLSIAKQFNAVRADLVGDRYDDISIKGLERVRREQSGQHYVITSPDQKLPVQWKKFLSSGNNKQALQVFIAEYIPKTTSVGLLDVTVVVALTATATQLNATQSNITASLLPRLTSDHEEADTRLILHANDCASVDQYTKVVIWSPDTDVAVIATEHSPAISAEVLFATGTGKHQRLINLTTIATTLGPVAKHLTAVHALSGCDTTSSFHGKGKKSILNIVRKHEEHLNALALIGANFSLSTTPPGIELLICQLYGAKSETVNDARYELFRSGNSQDRCLPPNLDALNLHLKRVNYQVKVWRSALSPMINCPSPDGHGWSVTDGGLTIHWLDQPYAPTEVLQTKRCSCSKGCKSSRCSCIKAFMVCTALCGCVTCENRKATEDQPTDGEESDEQDD